MEGRFGDGRVATRCWAVWNRGPHSTAASETCRRRGGPKTFKNQFPADEIGAPIQTYSPSQLATKTGKVNYVVLEDGTLRLGRIRNEVGGGHIDLAGGRPVQAAGELKVIRGDIRYVDNSSGHYLPSGPEAQGAAEAAFKRSGIDVAGKYIEKVWNGQKWVAK